MRYPVDMLYNQVVAGFHDHPENEGGLDFAPLITGDIYVTSIEDGRVKKTGFQMDTGNYVIIKHKDGYLSMYFHLDKVFVGRWKKVRRGQVIATMGNSGKSTGKHLHLGIKRYDELVDPKRLLIFDMPVSITFNTDTQAQSLYGMKVYSFVDKKVVDYIGPQQIFTIFEISYIDRILWGRTSKGYVKLIEDNKVFMKVIE